MLNRKANANPWKRLAALIIGVSLGFAITVCDSPVKDKDQTPIFDDFDVTGTGTFAYDGSPKTVTVTAKDGKTSGAVTVKYDGSETAPSAVGTYTVTFDVAAAPGWNAASGLSAESLTIGNGNPAAADFNITGAGTVYFNGDLKTVAVTAKDGKTEGEITVYYEGTGETEYEKIDEAPYEFGTYAVTFDVEAAEDWNEASGLSAGTLTIADGTPGTPTGVNAAAASLTSIRVSWSTVTRATSYNVYYIGENDDELELAGTATGTSYTHTGLETGTAYWYYVTAANSYGESDYSDYKAAVISVPPPPATVEATATSSSTINLRWSSVSGAASYKVYYNTTGPSGAKSSWANNTYTGTSCSVTGTSGNTTYYFFVKSVNVIGESDYSEPGSVKTLPANYTLGLRFNGEPLALPGGYMVQLVWNRTSNPMDGYDIYRSVGSPDNFQFVASIPYGSHSMSGLASNTTYYFYIKHYPYDSRIGKYDRGGHSEIISLRTGAPAVITPLPPTPPTVIIPSTPPPGGSVGAKPCTICYSGTCKTCVGSGTVSCHNYQIAFPCNSSCKKCRGTGKVKCGSSFCNSGKCKKCGGTGKV